VWRKIVQRTEAETTFINSSMPEEKNDKTIAATSLI
jgi:hypothetical protein